VRLTGLLNPFVDVTVTVYVVLEPCLTVWLEGEAETEKSGAPEVTTNWTVVVWTGLPVVSVPVIVKVYVPVGAVLVVWTVRVEVR